nr:hypothetical protein [uncultured Neokomagataea sp.]
MNSAVRRALSEDRRWFILDALAQMENRALNDDIILMSIRTMGRPAMADDIRDDLELLEREQCVTLERLPRSPGRYVWVATLTAEGLQVRDNTRSVPGVASRRPL